MDFLKWWVDKNCVIFNLKEFDKNKLFDKNRKANLLLLFKLKQSEDWWIVLIDHCIPGCFEVKKLNPDQGHSC